MSGIAAACPCSEPCTVSAPTNCIEAVKQQLQEIRCSGTVTALVSLADAVGFQTPSLPESLVNSSQNRFFAAPQKTVIEHRTSAPYGLRCVVISIAGFSTKDAAELLLRSPVQLTRETATGTLTAGVGGIHFGDENSGVL